MAYSLVAHQGVVAGVAASVTTPAVDSTGADLIAVGESTYTDIPATSLADNMGNTYTPLTLRAGSLPGNDARARLWYVENAVVGSGHTVTLTNGLGFFGGIIVQAWSGGKLSGAFDQENGALGTGSSLATGSVTPSENNELIVTVESADINGPSASIDSGFSLNAEVFPGVSGTNLQSYFASLVQGPAGAVNPTWSPGGSASTAVAIASFKAAAGGGGGSGKPWLYYANQMAA